jgi:hypothetical protein
MREQGMFDPSQLVFLDETCTNTAMVRLRGRSPRGERLIGYAPRGSAGGYLLGACLPSCYTL